jgi:hypothetical protein
MTKANDKGKGRENKKKKRKKERKGPEHNKGKAMK